MVNGQCSMVNGQWSMNNAQSSHRHVETALLHLVFDVAALLLAHITEHLTEHPLQRIVAHHAATRPIGILHRLIAVVADIERRAVEMAGVLGGITVTATQLCDIVLRTEHAGDNQLVEGHTLHIETVEERLADVLQQDGSSRHEIWDARLERIDMEIRIGTNIDQFALTALCVLTVLDGCDAPLLGSHQLYGIGIRKSGRITGHREDAMMLFALGGGLGRFCDTV